MAGLTPKQEAYRGGGFMTIPNFIIMLIYCAHDDGC